MWMKSFDCERVVCFINGGTLVTDKNLQDQDWDIVTDQGRGVSVKLQRRASQVVDSVMVEKWLKKTFPNVRSTSDALNFHNCISGLERQR